jgi:hypothetical protein
MTLRELRAAHPALFHPNQDWFADEQFLDLTPRLIPWPTDVWATGTIEPRTTAADLAGMYLTDPTHPMWQRYLWTCDHDRHGQRVYVGDNGHGFEIHRHIHLTDRFGVPAWR